MYENVRKLNIEFEKIKAKGYIRGIYNNYSSIGRTFENELNLPENAFSIPDYYGIEIKTRRAYSKSAITLFNAVPDGRNLFEVERLKETYGYPYKNDKRYKVIYIEASGNQLKFAGINYQYKLDVDRNERKVYLSIFNRYNELIEREIYWSFDYLEERVINKLKFLAIVNAWTNKINGWNYFKYYKMDMYMLRDFNTFIDLLEKGTIRLKIKVGIHLDEKKYGKTYDHGCGFIIDEYNLPKLFYQHVYKPYPEYLLKRILEKE